MRRVRHARVAEVLDADVAGQMPYLVTRFVPGQDPRPVRAGHTARCRPSGSRIGRGLAAALQAIHAAGVVHRDIKPANVMLVDGEPVLIDFGIAHLADESRITVTGLVMGTPGYLSPEVVDGQPVSVGDRLVGLGGHARVRGVRATAVRYRSDRGGPRPGAARGGRPRRRGPAAAAGAGGCAGRWTRIAGRGRGSCCRGWPR